MINQVKLAGVDMGQGGKVVVTGGAGYSGAAEPQFRSRVSHCSGNYGATVPVMRATQDYRVIRP